MWNIAICDDEENVCLQLRSDLKQIEQKIGCRFSVLEFHSAEDLLENISDNRDILLLDIKMGDISGIEAARSLRAINNDICIIFITNMIQYAIEGYEVHAFGFLKKPLDRAQLEWFLTDAIQKLEQKRNNKVNPRIGGEIKRIATDSIIYIEVFSHQVNMHTKSGVICPTMTLTELETLLNTFAFFRCHKSYLINLHHVSRILDGKIIMTNGDTVFLSRRRAKEFLAEFAQFAGGTL